MYNALLLTMVDSEISDGEIWINGDQIEYIGKSKISENGFDKEIDVKRNLVMPGFKNAHAHSAMTFARAYADDVCLDEWLHKKIFPLEQKVGKSHVYYYSMLAFMECIASGITAVFDMYYEPEAMMQASIDAGMRTVLCGAINDFRESIDLLEEYYKIFNDRHSLISYVLGFHAEYTTSISMIKNVAHLAHKYQAPVYTHNSETKQEVSDCIRRYGLTPTQLFDSSGIYDFGGGGFHCVHLTHDDIEIFLNKNLNIVTNTCSNLKLCSGVAPIFNYQKAGINVAMGTDGAGSNNALDMFREIYICAVLQKMLQNNVIALSEFDVLKMATVNGTKVMGLQNCDYLVEGKKADLIVIDVNSPNMQPANNIISSLVYSAGKQNVLLTMINGEILYQNGAFTSIDEQEIYYNVNKLMHSLV